MQEKTLSKWQNRLIYAAIAGGILLVYKILLLVLFGPGSIDKTLNTLDFIFVVSLLIVSMVKGIKRYRDEQLEGFIPYGKAFNHGFFICFLAVILRDMPTWVYNSFISDVNIQKSIDQAYDMLYELQGAEIAESMITIYENVIFTPTGMMISLIFGAAFTALIISVIVSGFTKREKPLM